MESQSPFGMVRPPFPFPKATPADRGQILICSCRWANGAQRPSPGTAPTARGCRGMHAIWGETRKYGKVGITKKTAFRKTWAVRYRSVPWVALMKRAFKNEELVFSLYHLHQPIDAHPPHVCCRTVPKLSHPPVSTHPRRFPTCSLLPLRHQLCSPVFYSLMCPMFALLCPPSFRGRSSLPVLVLHGG